MVKLISTDQDEHGNLYRCIECGSLVYVSDDDWKYANGYFGYYTAGEDAGKPVLPPTDDEKRVETIDCPYCPMKIMRGRDKVY